MKILPKARLTRRDSSARSGSLEALAAVLAGEAEALGALPVAVADLAAV
jgi:hypothetical protein